MKTLSTITALRILLLLAAILPLTKANAHDFMVNGVYYNINGNEVTVTYRGTYSSQYLYEYSGNVTIPSTVTYKGITYSVTSIGHDAFSYCSELTSITIPNSVTSIGNSAFYSCNRLTSITVPNSVTSIGSSAFYYCTGLTSISIPNTVTSIGNDAFYECRKLNNVNITDLATWCNISFANYNSNPLSYAHHLSLNGSEVTELIIPNTVTSIAIYAFYGCSGLTSVSIPNTLTSIGNNAFSGCSGLTCVNITDLTAWCNISFDNSDSNPLSCAHHLFLNGSEVTELIIPNTFTSIGKYAFYGCSGLTSVSIPNTLTSIGNNAFSGCSGLTSVNITELAAWCNISFGSNPLSYAHHLYLNGSEVTELIIPNTVTSIASNAFSGCSGFASVSIPNTVTSIGNNAFNGCSGLASVNITDLMAWCNISFGNSSSNPLSCAHHLYLNGSEVTDLIIPNTVTSIGKYAFSGCKGLISITIPNSVTSIGTSAFQSCSEITRVNITDIATWCSISFTDFNSNPLNYAHHLYLNGSEVTDLIIPNSVTSIGNYALNGCSGLTSITIPNSVISIGNYAFNGCSGLSSITIPNSVTSIGNYAFNECNGLKNVYSNIANPSLISMGYSVFGNSVNSFDRILHVPVGSVAAYQANASWEPYFGTIIDNDSEIQNFKDGTFWYSITSDSNVTITRQAYWDNNITYYDWYHRYIDIPSHVTFNNVDYTVTAIGDSVFYCPYNLLESYETVSYEIIIPETVSSIGVKAFGGYFDLVNIICFAKTPPSMNNSFNSSEDYHGEINIFVKEDAYPLYVEENNNNHYFDSIYITNGERSKAPHVAYCELEQPVEYYPYGCRVFIYPSEVKSVIYLKEYDNYGLGDNISCSGWGGSNLQDTIYYSFENTFSCAPAGWAIDYFAIEEGKSPSYIGGCGELYGEKKGGGFFPKWYEYFDFMDSNICYSYRDSSSVAVTYASYGRPCGEKEEKIIHYSGDIVIPSTVTNYNNYNSSFTSYLVNEIGQGAFWGCTDLTSITIPSSISRIDYNAFGDCTTGFKVKITDLGAWCNIDIHGEYANPLYYAHHLYLNDSEVTDLVIPNTVKKINGFLFAGCSGLTSVTVSNSVTIILDHAFMDCSGLTSVNIGNSVSTICYEAFMGCPNITSVKCLGKSPAELLGPDKSEDEFLVFDDCVYQNATLYVPMEAVEAYKNAEGWKRFQHIVGFYDYDYVEDGVYYTVTGEDEVMVVHGDDDYQGVVNIPETVTYEGVTYNVAGISSGAFADATLQSLILPVSIANVEDGAFDGCHINSLIITGNGAWTAGAIAGEIDNLYVMSTVTGIGGLQVNPTTIYSYGTVPPTCNDNTFTGYDGELHVPASSLAAYFTAPYWSNFINITGDAVEPTGIKFNNDSIEVLVGNQLSLNATITPSNAVPRDLIWTTSDEDIATVTDGDITAIKAGECDIKAYLLDKSAICHVTVTEITPTEVTLNQEFAKLEIGSQLTLTATVLPDNATDKQVTWATTNSGVATVDSLGHVTAVGEGECFITATCRDKQATCHVIVIDHFIYITLDEHDVRLLPNHMMTLTPTVSPANTTLVVTSSDPTVAAARMANGKIQLVGIKEGSTVITVNSTDGYAETDSCLVKVYTLRGDVNSDGFVNISDVTALINRLFSGPTPTINEENADANNDGNITIADVTALISSLLSGEPLPPKDESIEDNLTFTVNGVTFTMVAVEGGTFTMGATPEQGDDALDGEKPAHQVTLSDYAIGQTEVTQALWVAVMGTNPSRFKDRPENPVELVDWNDCQAFITQLNQLTGKQFRLPTEAEWEYAARGGNKSQGYKYAGSNNVDEVAWYSDNCNSTQPVGSKKANELGIFDMSGNVWEWCQDYYGSYTSAAQTNPTGPATGTDRIRRGVGWNGSSSSGRVSHRSSREETYKYNSQGLRLAL